MLLAIIIIYMLLMVFIGIYGRKKVKNFNDFLTTGKRATLLMIMGSCIGAQIGSGFVVGGAESGALMGISGAWYGIGCGISYIIIGFLLAKFVYRNGYVTVSDFFEKRYGGKTTKLIYSIATPISCIASLAAQVMAGSAIFVALGMDGTVGAIISMVVVLAYSCISGLWGAQMTSVFQVGIIIVALIVGFVILMFNGAGAALASLPAASWSWFNLDSVTWVAMVVPTITVAFVDQSIFQRIVSAKDEKASIWGHVGGGLIMLPIAVIPVLIGMYGQTVYPDAAASSVFWLVVLEKLPVVVSGLLVAAVLAAVMSTCDCVFLAVSATTVHDLYKGMINPNADDKTCTRLSIIINIIVGALATLFALSMTGVLNVISIAYTFTSAGCLVPFVAGALWKKGTEKGAIWSAIIGIAFALCGTFGLINIKYDILSTLVALVVYIVVSLLTYKREGQVA